MNTTPVAEAGAGELEAAALAMEEKRAAERILDAAMEAIRAWPEAYQAAVEAMGAIFDEYHPHLSSA